MDFNITTMNTNLQRNIPHLKSLAVCLDKVVSSGYSESYKVEKGKLISTSTNHYYLPGEINIANFYSFECLSDPGDNVILYVIETKDGGKGTLIGDNGDPVIKDLLVQVKDVH
jgi:hypothetical protein